MFRLAAVATMFAMAIAGNVHDRAYYEQKFFDWMAEHNVKPATGERFVSWLQNFANNEDLISAHNGEKSTYTLGHNQFSHMSPEEWKAYVSLGLKKPEETEQATFIHEAPLVNGTLAASIDWVALGAVTAVKDQGQCGSCWSFSATGAMEGSYYKTNNMLHAFSEQNFVDCDTRSGSPRGSDMGCNGGLMDSAFSWAKKNGGVCTESDYPYTSGTTKKSGTCADSRCVDPKSAPKSYTDVEKNSDSAMMSALMQQPVSIAIQADQTAFQLYKSGVFTAACGDSLDHGVLAVGYGTLDGTDYYKVKNSWGASWGMDGYILLERGVSQRTGQCGMLSGPPSYPTL